MESQYKKNPGSRLQPTVKGRSDGSVHSYGAPALVRYDDGIYAADKGFHGYDRDYHFNGPGNDMDIASYKQFVYEKRLYWARKPGTTEYERRVKRLRPVVSYRPVYFGVLAHPIVVKTLKRTKLMERVRVARNFRICSQSFDGKGYDPHRHDFYVKEKGVFILCHDTFDKDSSLIKKHSRKIKKIHKVMKVKRYCDYEVMDSSVNCDVFSELSSYNEGFSREQPEIEFCASKKPKPKRAPRINNRDIAIANDMVLRFYAKNPHLCQARIYRSKLKLAPLRRSFGDVGSPFVDLAYKVVLIDHLVYTHKVDSAFKGIYYKKAVESCLGSRYKIPNLVVNT